MGKVTKMMFVLLVLGTFMDKENPGKKLIPGDTLNTDDLDRVNFIVRNGLGKIVSVKTANDEGEKDSGVKLVTVSGTEYEQPKVKAALKAIGVEVAANAGADAVESKIAGLTEEQVGALSAKLSE